MGKELIEIELRGGTNDGGLIEADPNDIQVGSTIYMVQKDGSSPANSLREEYLLISVNVFGRYIGISRDYTGNIYEISN